MNARASLRFLTVAVLFVTSAFGLDVTKLKPTGYVNDFAHAIDAASFQRLTAYCGAVEQATGAQMAIVTVDSLDGDDIDDVANKLYHQWGIGKKPKDEGVLILFAIKDKKDRAEIGYGLEPVITDGDAGSVMRGIRPILRQGTYGPAALAEQFGAKIADSKGVTLPTDVRVRTRTSTGRSGGSIPWPLIIIGIFFLLSLLGRGGGGGFGGFLTGMFLGNMMGRGGGGWGGGGFGGSGGGDSGGGFGGFGGGDSGGGGASSDW
jgi:uncharacterized protein